MVEPRTQTATPAVGINRSFNPTSIELGLREAFEAVLVRATRLNRGRRANLIRDLVERAMGITGVLAASRMEDQLEAMQQELAQQQAHRCSRCKRQLLPDDNQCPTCEARALNAHLAMYGTIMYYVGTLIVEAGKAKTDQERHTKLSAATELVRAANREPVGAWTLRTRAGEDGRG